MAVKARKKKEASRVHRQQMGVLKDQIRVRVREKQRRKETSLPTRQAVESIIMQHLEENNPSEDFEVDLEELLSTET